jgi:hypothetical protein
MSNPFDEFDDKTQQPVAKNPFDDIEALLAQQSKADRAKGLKELAESQSGFQKFLIATGKGFTDVGRGVKNMLGGNAQPSQLETESFEALRQSAPFTVGAGEIVGQAAPFAPAALAVGGLTASYGLPTMVAGQAAVGGLEGATIAKGTGGDPISSAGAGAVIAGGIEAISPVLGRIGRQVYQRVTGQAPKGVLVDPSGNPTPEMQQALKQAGMSWQELTDQARRAVMAQPQGANPEQVARIAGFEQMNAPYSQGNITQADVDVGAEQRLLGSIVDPSAEQYRNLIMNQSQAFEREAQAIADNFNPSGQVSDVGQAVKDALMGRKTQLKAERKQLYGQLAEAARNAEGMPIFADDLLSKVDPDVNFGDIQALAPGAYDALNRVLVEFGVNRSNEALEAAAKAGVKPESIKPLSLSNFESFRKRLNNIVAADRTGAIANIAGPVKQALDEEIDMMAKTLEMSPIEDVARAAKEARRSHAALKTEFDDKAITAKLTDRASWGSNEPKVYASQVYQQVMAKSTPIEQTNKLIDSLNKSGGTGKLAINELRGQAVLDLLDSAMKAKSNKINGQLIFNGNAFVQAFTKNEDKIRALFAGDAAAMKRLENMVARAKDITPAARMTPKGSADVNMDIFRSLARFAGLAGGDVTTIGGAILSGSMKSGAIKSQAAQAANPKAQKVQYFNELVLDNYPRLAAGLGIAASKEDNQQKSAAN